MLEILLIVGVLFLIFTFFYKQAVCEFRINQAEWTQKEKIPDLLGEKIPLVVRSIPTASFWTQQDVLERPCFENIPIFRETSLTNWLTTSDANSVCPWKYPQAETIAQASGLKIWAEKWMNPSIIHPFLKWWISPKYHCWAGKVGLRKTFATWTCLFPVDGELTVTIMPENVESSLPSNWPGCFPSELTAKDTPFVNDLKFIDIILRPGNCLFMPAHWFVSWTPTESSEKSPMACTISYHTPISLLAFHASPHNK
jgi:hypothetical protein